VLMTSIRHGGFEQRRRSERMPVQELPIIA